MGRASHVLRQPSGVSRKGATCAARIGRNGLSILPVLSKAAQIACVLVIAVATGLVASATARAAPFAYITNCGSNDVSVIDTATNRVVATVAVGACPYAVAVNPAGTKVYVTNLSSDSVSVIDAQTNREEARVYVGPRPTSVTVHPDGTRIYVAYPGQSAIAVIDATALAVTRRVPCCGSDYGGPLGLVAHPDGSRLYATAARIGLGPPPPCGVTRNLEAIGIVAPPRCLGGVAGAVLVVDTVTLGVVKEIYARSPVGALAIDRSGTRVYVPGYDGTVVIDTTSDKAIATLPWGPAVAAAAHPAGTPVYVSRDPWADSVPPDNIESVLAIDAVSDRIAATIPIYAPKGLAVTPDGTRLFVASGSKWVAAIDVATNTVLDWIEVGTDPVAFGHFIGPAAPGANYQGLWWAAPAGSESGWGINFAHQADTIFASWFTYDLAGRDWWLVMTAQKSATATYAGTLYETRGPPFNAEPFDLAHVTATPVGTGTLIFADADRGTFAYVVRGVAQTKPITREVFGPLPVCTWGLLPDLAAATNYQDLWWAAPAGSESGWGINLNHQGDTIFATWFTYDLDGAPLWLVATAQKTGAGTFRGDLYRTTGPPFNAVPFDPARRVATKVGTATFTFSNGDSATFAYSVQLAGMASPAVQSKQITRQVFMAPGTSCR